MSDKPEDVRALTSQALPISRGASSSVRQGYSRSELEALYALGRTMLTSGDMGSAERIAKGLIGIAPDFSPAWLLLAYHALMQGKHNDTIFNARQALRVHPACIEALLFLVIGYFEIEDFQTGGTFLGEVAELVHGERGSPELKRLYDSQVIRFEERLRQGRRKMLE